jgi:hypothetical protein
MLASEDSGDDSDEGIIDGSSLGNASCVPKFSRNVHSTTSIRSGLMDSKLKKHHRIRRANHTIERQMDEFVQSLFLKKTEQIQSISDWDGKCGSQSHFPFMDSPNWGKYHNNKIDLALIKIKPYIPRTSDLCLFHEFLMGIEGDDIFARETKDFSKLGELESDIERMRFDETLPTNNFLEDFSKSIDTVYDLRRNAEIILLSNLWIFMDCICLLGWG